MLLFNEMKHLSQRNTGGQITCELSKMTVALNHLHLPHSLHAMQRSELLASCLAKCFRVSSIGEDTDSLFQTNI